MNRGAWTYWWSLPGPAGFVRSIIEDLRRGANVVIGLPRWAPIGLERAMTYQLRDDDLLSWRPLDLEQMASEDPLEILPVRYVHDLTKRDLCEGVDLARSETFTGTVVWVTGLRNHSLGGWINLLESYADAVRSRPVEERGLFCLVAEGIDPKALPKEDVALSVRLWRGAVTEPDMLAWLHHLMGRRPVRNAMERRLMMRLALEIAGYDAQLALEAANLDLERLGDPMAWLLEVAADRGWSVRTEPAWEDGSCDTMEERRVVHSALLAVSQEGQKEVEQLLWRAQVGVLFPLLEEERRCYLQEYASLLRVPHDTGLGSVIRDKEELELGHIHYQLRYRLGRREQTRLQMLRNVRNSLAHQKVLAPVILKELVRL